MQSFSSACHPHVFLTLVVHVLALTLCLAQTHGVQDVAGRKRAYSEDVKSVITTKFLRSSGVTEEHRNILLQLVQNQRRGRKYPQIDPDANRNLTELIISQGYPSETYTVQTADGFLLDAHRIPHGRNESGNVSNKTKPVVFLQHGLLSSACDWVMNFANDSLGFILADAGYDVWMGNSRGNTYSRRHINLKPDDDRFWDWSFDEMAKFDLPAFIDFTLNKTGESSLFYIGHSQGTLMAFALFSQRSDIQAKIKLFVALAPVANVTYIESPIRYTDVIPDELIYKILGKREFLPNDELVKFAVDHLCTNNETRWVCYNIVFLLCGHDLSNLNQSRLAVYMNHSPAGVSVKDMVHLSQMIREKRMMMYDYGSADNMKHYGQPTPPDYNVTKVTVPVLSFTGSNDWLADPKDAAILLASLPNLQNNTEIFGWEHLDFTWGEDAGTLCYHPILPWLKKFA